MLKVTKQGIESGTVRELTEEELDFIEELFREHSEYEREFHYHVQTGFDGSI